GRRTVTAGILEPSDLTPSAERKLSVGEVIADDVDFAVSDPIRKTLAVVVRGDAVCRLLDRPGADVRRPIRAEATVVFRERVDVSRDELHTQIARRIQAELGVHRRVLRAVVVGEDGIRGHRVEASGIELRDGNVEVPLLVAGCDAAVELARVERSLLD